MSATSRVIFLMLVLGPILPASSARARITDEGRGEEQSAAAQPAKKPAPVPAGWRFSGNLRSRVETWDWFDPGSPAVGNQNQYTYWATYFRPALSRSWKRADVFAEASIPVLLGLPSDATAPAPMGQLGLGAAYRAANGDRKVYAFARQAYVTLKNVGSPNGKLRLGRFEFIDGAESMTQDATMDWIKRERVAHRVIGNFVFTHVQRTADGLHFSYDARGTNVSVVAARPTVGVFELNGNKNVPNVEYVYSGLTHTSKARNYDARAFFLFYHDDRGVLPADNRPLAARRLDTRPLKISTFGGHLIHKFGPTDVLAWGAVQTGDWGLLSHRAWAWDLEFGYQPKGASWKPWLRAGASRTSGDSNPADVRHGTFFQVLPTPRIYARFPFYNMMNLEDYFLGVLLRPGSRWTIRHDQRWLSLTRSTDLWYSGGGAFQKGTFGFAGRPSGGADGLARLTDVSVEFRPAAKTTLTFYYGHAVGQSVIRSVYPTDSSANLALWELAQRF